MIENSKRRVSSAAFPTPTSDDTPEARARCMAAGADAFLVKAGKLAPRLLSTIQEFFPDDLEENDNQPQPLRETLATVTWP